MEIFNKNNIGIFFILLLLTKTEHTVAAKTVMLL